MYRWSSATCHACLAQLGPDIKHLQAQAAAKEVLRGFLALVVLAQRGHRAMDAVVQSDLDVYLYDTVGHEADSVCAGAGLPMVTEGDSVQVSVLRFATISSLPPPPKSEKGKYILQGGFWRLPPDSECISPLVTRETSNTSWSCRPCPHPLCRHVHRHSSKPRKK